MRSRLLVGALLGAIAAATASSTPTPTSTSTPTSTPGSALPLPSGERAGVRGTSSTRSAPSPQPSPPASWGRGSSERLLPLPSGERAGVRGAPATFLPADPAHAWSFPRDHFARPGYRNEWWYFTGTLAGTAGQRFGFQLTFFKVGILPARPALDSAWAAPGAVMAHLAVTDVGGRRHRFAEVVWREAPLLAGFGAAPGPRVAWAQSPPGSPGRWTLDVAPVGGAIPARTGGAGGAAPEPITWRLAARDDAVGVALRLELTPARPTVLQGPNGYSRKAAADGFASEYYSQTRLAATGVVELDGVAAEVRGEAWMDREVGSSQLAPSQVGWDWFALRLADGRDLMLYLLRRADGAVDWRNGTLVARDGTSTALPPEAWSIRPTGRWRSAASGADYPSGWRLEVPSAGLSLQLEPALAAAENRSRLVEGLSYWEGPVIVSAGGEVVGEGYAELTGYGAGGRLPL
ncbi:MAG: carotenoid 1,2-hydratase [Anaeromyxobacter sp.]|nr:carotenoid 1,2-hydratase [Anaeromyxobacter sp.]MBL0278658.1 carotenoid 1,2-hydratase [Anaeromyxobacter sp.]